MRKKTLSIIMFNYNYSKFLKQSLVSLLNQTRQPDEVIIIDDKSTDNSVKIIEDLIKDISFAHLFKNEVNEGIICSMNKGLSLVSKDYVSFFSSDDKLSLNFVEENMKFVEKNSDIAFCCSLPTFFKNSKNVWIDDFNCYEETIFDPDNLVNIMKKTKFWIATHTSVIKRKAIKNRFFNPVLRCYTDWYFILDIAFSNKIGFIPKSLSFMRVHLSAYSRQMQKYRDLKKIYSFLLDKIEKKIFSQKKRFIDSRVLSSFDKSLFFFILFKIKYWKYLPSIIYGKILRFFIRIKRKCLKILNKSEKDLKVIF